MDFSYRTSLKCVLFDFSSPSKLLLHKHEMGAHHKKGSNKVHAVQKVKCWQCDVICSTKPSLAKHLRFVHDTKNECADKEETENVIDVAFVKMSLHPKKS